MKFPEPYCECSPSGAHYFTKLNSIMRGIWRCKYCGAVKWLPTDWEECISFSLTIKGRNIQKAYDRALRYRPEVLKILITLGKEAE